MGSADWLPRNFFRRIEIVFPIENGNLRERIIREILGITLADNCKARFLQADGSYRRLSLSPGTKRRRSQPEFIDVATAGSQLERKSATKRPKYAKMVLAKSPLDRGR
jgi:polyphosphate kinase